MLVIVFGLPGTGKTFFASALAQALRCRHLNTDVLRREAGEKVDYSVSGRKEIYDVMLARAEEALHKKEDLILDGTFLKKKWRDKFEKKGWEYEEEVKFIEIKADEEEIQKRVNKRREFSDADFNVYLKLKKEFEPLEKKHLILWSDKIDLTDMIEAAKDFLGKF